MNVRTLFARSYGHTGFDMAYKDGFNSGLWVALAVGLILDAIIIGQAFALGGCR